MISGISGNDGLAPRFITNVRALPPKPPVAEPPAVEAPESAAELGMPSGNEDQLTHEFTMLDLASRHFARILPDIETVTAPIE